MSHAILTEHVHFEPGGAFALQDLNMRVPSGAIYGFLGPNGAGKTTTIRLVLGLLRPSRGSIRVLDGEVPRESATILRQVGYVPEQPHFDGALTVRELLTYQAAFYPTWDWPFAERTLRELALDDHKLFRKLSKGQKAKVMMLAALSQRPSLLVLDEPTDGLDPVSRRDLLATLTEYVSVRQATVLISSHLVHELERICSWVGVMDAGRLITELPMDEFRTGMKRLIVVGLPASPAVPPPFVIVARKAVPGGGEALVVRQWTAAMAPYFTSMGATLQDVSDLDLEDGFVELLRAFRSSRPEA